MKKKFMSRAFVHYSSSVASHTSAEGMQIIIQQNPKLIFKAYTCKKIVMNVF